MEMVLSVPETVVATYVVATDRPPADPAAAASAAAARIEGPLGEAVRRMLDGPLMQVGVSPVADAPPLPVEHLRMFGGPAEALRAVVTATHLVVVQAAFGPGWPPAHEWHARAVAAGIAADTGGALVDLYTPQVLDPAAALASLPRPDGTSALSAWVLVPQFEGDRGLTMITRGLGRFGLPELQLLDVPPALGRAWTSALTGIARALVVRWAQAVERAAGAAFVRVPDDLTVTAADATLAYGNPPGPGAQARAAVVRLRLDRDDPGAPEPDALLTVGPPEGFAYSAGEFLARVPAELFGVQPGNEADEAVATARAGLPAARERFLAGEFGVERHLVVKHRLTRGEATELIWSTVTTWPDPRRLHGVSMSDAEIDPAVRTGRPTMVREPEIVDWGVWSDGAGIVEGGWTNAVPAGE
ncbi:DUF2314 domain-containing protein [Dactylosporangium sp. CS-033363]|uniref:DUF2314 domain-containing protein n=1 Tax=Dactylosporangium sp. CS-033363 TaxID=3239935 RepID=UPI003D9077C4